MNRTVRLFFIGWLILLLAVVFTACSGNQTDNVSKEPEFVDFELREKSDNPDAKNIYVITKSHYAKYWQDLSEGAINAGSDSGNNIYVGGIVYETDIDGQIALLNEAYEAGADVLVFSPVTSGDVFEWIKKFHEADIPVILVDTIFNDSDFDVCYMTDNLNAGKMAAQAMIESLRENGCPDDEPLNIGIHIGSDTSQTILERLAGFYEHWSQNAPEKWTILDQVYCNNGDAEYAAKLAEKMFSDFDNVKGVIGLNSGSTVGLSNCIMQNDRRDIMLVGFDFSDEVVSLISNGYHAKTILQKQYDMGYQGVIEGLSILDGHKPELRLVDTEVELVSIDNLADYQD